MFPARQSTALETAIGPVLDASGVAVTDCVVGDFKIKKTTGNFAALNGSATLTHVSAGMYDLVLTTSDTDTVGLCCVAIDDTTNACAPIYLQVIEEAIYDALYAASATGALPVSTGGIAAAAFAAGAIDAAAIANGAIDAATFAADVDAEILSYLVDDATRIDASSLNTATVTTIPAILADTGTDGVVVAAGSKTGYSLTATTGLGNQTADITGSLSGSVGSVTGAVGSVTGNVGGNVAGSVGSVTGAVGSVTGNVGGNVTGSVGSVVGAVGSVTGNVGGNVTGSVGSLATQAKADVNAEVDSAIETYHLDHLLAADYDPASKPGVSTALLNELVGNDGGVSQFTANALELAPTGSGGGGGGSGARTVTITVNDGSTALQNANVRMIQGAENYVVATNASGVAVFALDDATWSVAITKPGYTFTPTTLIVNGTENETYSMTALTITPSNPGQVTGYLTIFGIDGEVEEGAEIHLQQLQPISGSGIGYDGAVRTEESGVDGVVEFTNMFKGGRYNIWRGTDTANKKQFTLASNATDPTALSSFVGSP